MRNPTQEAAPPRDLAQLAAEVQALAVHARNTINTVLRDLEAAANSVAICVRTGKVMSAPIMLQRHETEQATGKIAANYVNKLLLEFTDKDEQSVKTIKLPETAEQNTVQAPSEESNRGRRSGRKKGRGRRKGRRKGDVDATPDVDNSRRTAEVPAAATPSEAPLAEVAAEANAQASSLETAGRGLFGDGTTIAIPDLLSFLSGAQKSGVFEVKSANESFVITLQQGDVVHATGDSPPEGMRLGDILVSQGFIERSVVDEFMKSDDSEMLGSALLKQGSITEHQLLVALSLQVQNLFNRLFAAKEARFSFHEGARVVENEDVRVNVMQLLLESARLKDEAMIPSNLLDPGLLDASLLDPLPPETLEVLDPLEELESVNSGTTGLPGAKHPSEESWMAEKDELVSDLQHSWLLKLSDEPEEEQEQEAEEEQEPEKA